MSAGTWWASVSDRDGGTPPDRRYLGMLAYVRNMALEEICDKRSDLRQTLLGSLTNRQYQSILDNHVLHPITGLAAVYSTTSPNNCNSTQSWWSEFMDDLETYLYLTSEEGLRDIKAVDPVHWFVYWGNERAHRL